MDIQEKREEEKTLYAEIYKNEKTKYGNSMHAKNILSYIKSLNINSIADIGCGRGDFPIWMKKQGCKIVYGIDFAANFKLYNDVIYKKSYAHDLPLKDNEVEYVTSFDMMEHLIPEDIDNVLNEFDRVSTKGMIFSICYKPSKIKIFGKNLHPSVYPEKWWINKLKKYGIVKTYKEYLIVYKLNKPIEKHNCKDKTHKSYNDCINSFRLFDVRRRDNSILEESIENILNIDCDLLKLKKLLIRLRRGCNSNDWKNFKNIFENDYEYYTSILPDRWIISVLDTYADNDEHIISRNAMIASNQVTMERWFHTYHNIFQSIKREDIIIKNRRFYGEMITLNLKDDDAVKIYFNRILKVLNETPIILNIYKTLIKNLYFNKKSFLNILCDNCEFHDYVIKDMFLS